MDNHVQFESHSRESESWANALKESNVLADVCSSPMTAILQGLNFIDRLDTNKRRCQKKPVKIFLKFAYFHKTQPGQKLLEIPYVPPRKYIRQMLGYRSLAAGLNVAWFPEVMASPKATRHQATEILDKRQ